MTRPLEVELPVCPTCGQVGRQPNQSQTMRNACVGRPNKKHPKVNMAMRRFREVTDRPRKPKAQQEKVMA